MGRRPREVPHALGDAFTVQQALAVGVTRKQLERLPAPYRGVRCRRQPVTLAEHATAVHLALPVGAAFAGRTAGHLLGLWLPRSWEPDQDMEIVVPPGPGRVKLRGVRCRRGDVDVVDALGLPVSSPADVFAQLAEELDLVDLVILADSTARWGSQRGVRELTAALRPGRRGRRRALRALRLAREGSASAQETRARLWLVDAGLPEPELNAEIVLPDRITYGDLVWRDLKVIVEYHGSYHFETPEQQRADLERQSALRRAGWTVIEIEVGTFRSRDRRDAFIDEVAAALGVHPRPRSARGRTVRTPHKRRRVERSRFPLTRER